MLDGGRDIPGRDIPEYQVLAPALREDEVADAITVNDMVISPNSSIETLRTAGRFLGVPTSGSKQKIFNRIRAFRISSLRLRALEVARGEYEALQPHSRFLDAPAQPSIQDTRLPICHSRSGVQCVCSQKAR